MPSRRKGFERTIAPLIDDFLLTEGPLKADFHSSAFHKRTYL